MQFEWDERKATANAKKHGVTLVEAASCFFDPHQIAFYDPDHSQNEERELLIGHSSQGRLVIASYTLQDDVIRIISARRATRQEAKQYAQGL